MIRSPYTRERPQHSVGPKAGLDNLEKKKISYFYKESNHDFSFVQETDIKINP